jgi:predicted RND superfamily exporter protein
MEKFSRLVINSRWIIILLVVGATVFFGYQIRNIKINSDILSSLPDSDPDAVLLKKIGEQFGGNRMGMVILENDNIFTTQTLEHIRSITDTIKELEGVSAVTSLTNIIDIKGGEDGVEVGKLVNEEAFPQSAEELQNLKQRVLSKEMYKGAIVSEDGTATVILFTLYDNADIQKVARAVIEKTTAMNLKEKIYYAGSPMMVSSIANLISSDLIKLIPIAFLLIAFVLFLGFHSVKGVVLPLLTAAIGIVWVIGLMPLGGFTMSMVSNNIPIVLLAVGTAYAIHVMNRIEQEKEQDFNKAIISALTYVAIPVLLAGLTTIGGFASFIFGSYLTMIRDFGIFTALGTLFTLLLSLTFVPAVISAFSLNHNVKSGKAIKPRRSYLTEFLLLPLKNVLLRHPWYTLITWGVLVTAGIAGSLLIERNVDIKNYFRKDNPTRKAEEIMTNKFGGTKPIFVLFKGDIQSPEVLQTMIRTEEFMKKNPHVETTQSVANLIVDLNEAMGEGRMIPDDKEKIEQLWFLIDGNDILKKFISTDQDEAVIISKFGAADNASKIEFGKAMRQFIKENSTPECTIEITGMPFVDVTMDRSLLMSQLGSLTFALIFVVIIVALLLRSMLSGIFAAIPIVATIVFLAGFMGFTGIPLNIATVLVASIAVGIGIDYSIHVIAHFNHSLKNGATIHDALEETMTISGKAIIINLTSVAIGFLVLIFSEMVPLQYFGLLVALSMLGSGLGALTLLPVILILANRKKRENIQ